MCHWNVCVSIPGNENGTENYGGKMKQVYGNL